MQTTGTPLTASPDGGRVTLERMDGAQNYNAWLGRKFRTHLGRRVLEIGAGIGTITREIEKDRELVVALEIEQYYVDKLAEVFRGQATRPARTCPTWPSPTGRR